MLYCVVIDKPANYGDIALRYTQMPTTHMITANLPDAGGTSFPMCSLVGCY